MVKARAPEDCITAEELRELVTYDPETGIMAWKIGGKCRKIGKEIGWTDRTGYKNAKVNCKYYLIHRLAWLYVTGKWPDYQVDHINMDKSDNRICNLREATCSENMANRQVMSNNKTGLKGVSSFNGEYLSQIKAGGKAILLGKFSCPELAHAAYVEASRKYFGDFHNKSLDAGG